MGTEHDKLCLLCYRESLAEKMWCGLACGLLSRFLEALILAESLVCRCTTEVSFYLPLYTRTCCFQGHKPWHMFCIQRYACKHLAFFFFFYVASCFGTCRRFLRCKALCMVGKFKWLTKTPDRLILMKKENSCTCLLTFHSSLRNIVADISNFLYYVRIRHTATDLCNESLLSFIWLWEDKHICKNLNFKLQEKFEILSLFSLHIP